MKFKNFSKKERKILIWGLIKECKSRIEYGLNGYNEEGKKDYNRALSLLREADSEREYEYFYKDWKLIEI